MFESLSDRLTGALSGLRGKGRLTDDDIDATAREIRLALLEAATGGSPNSCRIDSTIQSSKASGASWRIGSAGPSGTRSSVPHASPCSAWRASALASSHSGGTG